MTCSNCGCEIDAAARFCNYCGAPQRDDDATPNPVGADDPAANPGDARTEPAELEPARAGADPPSASTAPTPELADAILNLQAEVSRLSRRLGVLESILSRPGTTSGPARAATPSTTAQPTPPYTPSSVHQGTTPARTVPPSSVPTTPATAGAPPVAGATPGQPSGAFGSAGAAASFPQSFANRDWEWLLGGNWLARIGVVALIIGVGFFLKLAFDNDWIGEIGRVGLGLATGLALLGGSEFWRRKYPIWAQTLAGGGIAILYLSSFAAFSLYHLLLPLTALGLSFLITLAAAGLALRYQARTIAILGIIGGFATPLLLASAGMPELWPLLVYVVILDLGVLALAAFHNWRWFTLLGLVSSLILFAFWRFELEPSWWLAQIAISVIFLIFVAATTLFHLIWRRRPGPLDLTLMLLNATVYFGISYALLLNEMRVWMGAFTLLLALFYALLAYAILLRQKGPEPLSLMGFAIAGVLLIIAAPVQFDGPWVVVAWAAQATVLVWLSFLLKMAELRWFGAALLLLLTCRLILYDNWLMVAADIYRLESPYLWPLINWHFAALVAGVAALYLSAWAWQRWREEYRYPQELFLLPALLAFAGFLTLFGLSLEIVEAVERGFLPANPGSADNVISLSLSALWAAYAAILIVLGIARPSRWLRLSGLALLAVTIVKLFVYDTFELEGVYRVAAFVGLGLLLLAGGFLYQRYRSALRGFLLND